MTPDDLRDLTDHTTPATGFIGWWRPRRRRRTPWQRLAEGEDQLDALEALHDELDRRGLDGGEEKILPTDQDPNGGATP